MNSSPAPCPSPRPAQRRDERTLRRMLLGAALLVLVQAGVGIVVNLYVTVPAHHPGAKPSDYFAGSFHSVVWAVDHGTAALAVHAALGLALVVLAVGAAVEAVRVGRRAVTAWSVLGALLVIGAGFNGASFLDFNDNTSSLLMALLAFAAVASYAVGLFLVPLARPADSPSDSPADDTARLEQAI